MSTTGRRKGVWPRVSITPRRTVSLLIACAFLSLTVAAGPAAAEHSWGSYHWGRTTSSFTLQLGDNVSSTWDPYLKEASLDWSKSSVLETTPVTGGTRPKSCRPTSGRIEVCSALYGYNGWLGLAQIWVSGSHITQAIAKLNDTYFRTATYNKAEWRRLVMCQEIAHDFGLDHQDEVFDNPNLETCMDYTNNPLGPPSNEHPNDHDYEQVETIYSSHTDSSTTIAQGSSAASAGGERPEQWGRLVRRTPDGTPVLYERNLGGGDRLFTFVIWARGR